MSKTLETQKTQKTSTEIVAQTEHKNERQTLTNVGLIKLHTKINQLSEEKNSDAKIAVLVSFISDNMHKTTFNNMPVEQTLQILSDIDNAHLKATQEFSNLLRQGILILLYEKNNCYDDYTKIHALLEDFSNRKLFIAIQQQLLNSNYFITSYCANTVSNFVNGTVQASYNINNIILRPLVPSNNTREILESQGVNFFDKPADTDTDARDFTDRREQAYALLASEGLQDLLN